MQEDETFSALTLEYSLSPLSYPFLILIIDFSTFS